MFLDNMPAIIAGLSFYPMGVAFGHLFYLPFTDLGIYNKTEYWPFIITAFSAVITAGLLNGTKLNYRKHVFHHLYYLGFGLIFHLISGILYYVNEYYDITASLYLAAIGNGVCYISVLSYINIRTKKNGRSTLLAICHFYYLSGIATYAVLYYDDSASDLNKLYDKIGLCLIIPSAVILLTLIGNEIMQHSLKPYYDYKKCLDYNLNLANDSGNLLFRDNSNLNNNNNNQSPYWFTRTNLFNDSNHKTSNYQGLWSFYMILTKFQGVILFYYVFFFYTELGMYELFNNLSDHHYLMWFAVAGALLGLLILYFLRSKIVFVGASLVQIVALVVAVILLFNGEVKAMTIAFFVFYVAAGACYALPDMNILEVGTFKFKEGLLSMGHTIEIVSIGIFQYVSINHAAKFLGITDAINTVVVIDRDIFLGHIVGLCIFSLILVLLVILHMVNTFKRSLIDISYELIYNKSYTVFGASNDVPKREGPTQQRRAISVIGNQNNGYDDDDEKTTKTVSPSPQPAWEQSTAFNSTSRNYQNNINNAYNYQAVSKTRMLPRVSVQPRVNPNFDRY